MKICILCGGKLDESICKECGLDHSTVDRVVIVENGNCKEEVELFDPKCFEECCCEKCDQCPMNVCFCRECTIIEKCIDEESCEMTNLTQIKSCEKRKEIKRLCQNCPALGLFNCNPDECGVYYTIDKYYLPWDLRIHDDINFEYAKYCESSFGIADYFIKSNDGTQIYDRTLFGYPKYKTPGHCDENCDTCLTQEEDCYCRDCPGLGECKSTMEYCKTRYEDDMKNPMNREEYQDLSDEEKEIISEYMERDDEGTYYADKPRFCKHFNKEDMKLYKKITDPNKGEPKLSDIQNDFGEKEAEASSLYPGYPEKRVKPTSNIAAWLRSSSLFKAAREFSKEILNGNVYNFDISMMMKLNSMIEEDRKAAEKTVKDKENQILGLKFYLSDDSPVTCMQVINFLNKIGEKPTFEVDYEANVNLEATLIKYFASENKNYIEMVRYLDKDSNLNKD